MDLLRQLDAAVLRLIGDLVAGSVVPDGVNRALARLLEADFVKIGPLVLMLFHTWLRRGAAAGQGVLANPERAFRIGAGILGALATARLLQEQLPMQARPRALPGLVFPPLRDHLYGDFLTWSSLPSDHAVLAGALAAAIWAGSRRLGLLAAAWAVVVVCLPRIYFGLHYVSDVLAGLALGAVFVGLAQRVPVPEAAWGWLARWDARRPALVVLGLLVLGWEMIELFDTARLAVGGLTRLALPAGGAS